MIQFKSRKEFLPTSFNDLRPLLNKRPCFLFLDFDGTLVGIKDNPKDATLDAPTSKMLEQLSCKLSKRVAIVSARGLSALAAECDPTQFILAGNYGLEISFPSGHKFLHPVAAQAEPLMFELRSEITQLINDERRLLVDDHQYSFCLHLHRIPLEEQHTVTSCISTLEQKYASLHFRKLPTSFEIAPAIVWSKADALAKITAELSINTSEFLFMAFGDSPPDEPMFQWVNQRQGLSFKVGQRHSTSAVGALDNAADVVNFLRSLLLLDEPSNHLYH